MQPGYKVRKYLKLINPFKVFIKVKEDTKIKDKDKKYKQAKEKKKAVHNLIVE